MDIQLVSVDFFADFGFFKKPDTNATINYSYNFLHKPALLGIFGAILGLNGYELSGQFPEYYTKLKDLKIGIQPLLHERGSFQKTVIKYSNTVGYANKGANFLTSESTLIEPAYRCYALLDLDIPLQRELYDLLSTSSATYVPYFGKNEFSAWWENFKVYDFEVHENIDEDFFISTIFIKPDGQSVKKNKQTSLFFNFRNPGPANTDSFIHFERLPTCFHEHLHQYVIEDFVYTTFKIKKEFRPKKLLYLKEDRQYAQLF